ncbi:hypothetical protein Dform_01935 [Dehalogenimonas formicexedens]|uniref:Uncharacterized protein n=1 Tax=Dehalogenimonas formicexedens TaxID=1839801 RepID=A0A1P8F9X9_9CHLR|nr:hypothetical protein Dform_01935 [Dehalogenimonas formicexedens]
MSGDGRRGAGESRLCHNWMMTVVCHECGAELPAGLSCETYFHRALAWDFEDPAGAGAVHHLTVLCYFLQHPSRYSPEG